MIFDITYSTTLHQDDIRSVVSLFQSKPVKKIFADCKIFKPFIEKEVTLSFIGEKRMQSINTEFRGINHSTDILSFELHEGDQWGELYISPVDIQKNAVMMKHSFSEELIEIIIHGLLHLTGLDHSDDMFRWQKELTQDILAYYEVNSRTGESR